MVLLVVGLFLSSTPAPLFGVETRGACCGACCTLLCGAPSRESAPSSTMAANAADLVPAVEAYLEANGLKETLSAMKAEAKAKNMTPSKTVRGDPRGRAPRFARAARTVADAPKKTAPTPPPDETRRRPGPPPPLDRRRKTSTRISPRWRTCSWRPGAPPSARARATPALARGRPTAGTHRRHAPTHRRRRRVADDDRIGSIRRATANPERARAHLTSPPSLRSSRARSQGHEAQGRG